jgi:ABC-2 type transport system ATP-binding protein
MEAVQEQYVELMTSPEHADAARDRNPLFERVLFGRYIFLYKNANRPELQELGELHTPSVADLFVATMSNGGAS